MCLRSDHASGTSFAPRGQTPIVRATGQRFGCNMISAITNRGHLAFMVFHGKFDGRLFTRIMQRLVKQAPGKLSPPSSTWHAQWCIGMTQSAAPGFREKNMSQTRRVARPFLEWLIHGD
jgi:hypothetical protein